MNMTFTSIVVEDLVKLIASMHRTPFMSSEYVDESAICTIECVRIKGWRRITDNRVIVIVDYSDYHNKTIKVRYSDKSLNKEWVNEEINLDAIKKSIDYVVNNYNV